MCFLDLFREVGEGCRDLLKSCVSFRGTLEISNEEKNGEVTEGRGSIVKCGNTSFEERPRENPVRLSMYDGPIETAEHIWVGIWWVFQKTAEIHFLCMQLIN